MGKSLEMSPNRSQNQSESEDEEILQKCIASGMTANRNQNKSVRVKKSPTTPKSTPKTTPKHANNKTVWKELNTDQTRLFFVEDTPIEMSACYSWLSSQGIQVRNKMAAVSPKTLILVQNRHFLAHFKG